MQGMTLTLTPTHHDFSAVHAAMRRYVDHNILSGVSSAVLIGRDLVDVNCVGWADKEKGEALRVDHLFRVFSNTKPHMSEMAHVERYITIESVGFVLDYAIIGGLNQIGMRGGRER